MTKIEVLLQQHLPYEAVAYCLHLHAEYPFSFGVSRPRTSKWGDYRYRKTTRGNSHTITVNQNLNSYAFLITYLHEVAHRITFQQHGFRVPPHGRAWKQCFAQLLAPVLSESVFPQDVLTALRPYAQNPKAATGADSKLTLALQQYDTPTREVPLAMLNPDTLFRFRQRTYIKKKVRRTRALCQEISTRTNYLILETTPVERVD